jgi:ATP-dependent DNA helicase RecQ
MRLRSRYLRLMRLIVFLNGVMTFGPNTANWDNCGTHFPDIPLIALTATAEAHTRQDILRLLHLPPERSFVSGFDRPNIRYTVLEKNKPD